MIRSLVITGANSDLGSAALDHLTRTTDWNFVAIASPRAPTEPNGQRTRGYRCDLRRRLPPELKHAIRTSQRVLHFAWSRAGDERTALADNRAMLEQLLDAAGSADRMRFISSVAASRAALSAYGRNKYAAESLVNERGGASLVCGLVVATQPFGPHALLRRVVCRSPVSLRIRGGGPLTYPIGIDAVTDGLRRACDHELEPGSYALHAPPINLAALLSELEAACPKRRLPVVVDARLLAMATTLLARSPARSHTLAEKLLTFLHKDAARLAALPPVPEG